MRSWKTISGCVWISVLGLILFSFSLHATHLEFSAGKVVVRDLNPEILYTFCRYYDNQDEWKKIFPVTTSDSDNPIDGEYQVAETAVTFTPRYPFVANMKYIAKFYQGALSKNYNEVYLPVASAETLTFSFSVGVNTSAPRVLEIYPTADVLPENLLKFHIRFSSSMTRGEIYKRVKLYSDKKLVSNSFLIVDEELWDDEMKSVTLMFDPGRIKRGLRGNLEMGPPLQWNKRYRLVVENGWPDRFGNRTEKTIEKYFTCVPADRTQPDIDRWSITLPTSPGASLLLDLKESFDVDVLSHSMRIRDHYGKLVPGKFTTLDHQCLVVFDPAVPWQSGSYAIEVNPLLEDLAGNSFERLFDVDTTVPLTPMKTTITFEIVMQGQ